MNETIVFEQEQDLYTTSDTIAEFAEVSYRSVQRLIENHIGDLNEFEQVRFEITPATTKSGTNAKKLYYLNEQQATLLATYLKNTEPVREFKKKLVKQFYEMRKLILERQTVPCQMIGTQLATLANDPDTLIEVASSLSPFDGLANDPDTLMELALKLKESNAEKVEWEKKYKSLLHKSTACAVTESGCEMEKYLFDDNCHVSTVVKKVGKDKIQFINTIRLY